MATTLAFIETKRQQATSESCELRLQHYNEFKQTIATEVALEQSYRCMDCGIPFCQSGCEMPQGISGCPLQNLIPEYHTALANNQEQLAYERLQQTNNFPEFTGRVCPAPCEAACTCNLVSEPVTAHDIECYLIERAFANSWVDQTPPTTRSLQRIAIVGSGPAGLAAADSLNQRGHLVHVFEAADALGGLLQYGIPTMKLDKSIIDRRIAVMRAQGVHFHTSHPIHTKEAADNLRKSYDAVLLACGARQPRTLGVEGESLQGIHSALAYLEAATKAIRKNRKSLIDAKDKRVLVIGGGDTGNDCVGIALRQGCKEITQLEIMPRLPKTRPSNQPWPLWPRVWKLDYGQEEALFQFNKDPRLYQSRVLAFLGTDDVVKQAMIETQGEDGNSSSITKDVDLVILAAGFTGADPYLYDIFDIEQHPSEQREYAKIFMAGDMKRGPSLVVWAIKEGRQAAHEIDQYLMGYSNLPK
ncbi:MAG: glutamate synthase subunit beta [Serratia sp. (in: enterobacteria)]|uniref:glutamate synthase subunit beta n=1 Tax=Serratia sp. (in: enterobacteria) TaxID=616 RepID=UPI003F2EDFD8